MKSKHIDWTQGLKCDHQLWPWPWPWPWFFKVKYVICCISAQNGPLAMKQKANISIELEASNVTIRFDLGHELDLDFSRSSMEFAISQPRKVRLPWNEKPTYIEWIPGLKCDQCVWPWQWLWSLNFQGQFWPWLWPFGDKGQVKDLPHSDRVDFRCWRAINSSSCIWILQVCVAHQFIYNMLLSLFSLL